MHAAPPDDDLALLDLRDFALARRSAGKLVRAASVLQTVVVTRNRRSARDDDKTELRRSMSDWSPCFVKLGEIRSATETAKVVDSLASHRRPDGLPLGQE